MNIKPKIAIIVPAYNEEMTISKVIENFYNKYPDAFYYVVDNNSTDKTSLYAKKTFDRLNCKGEIIFESKQGKGNAIKNAFMNIDADVYVMVDADLTYSENDLERMLKMVVDDKYDICVGDRHSDKVYKKINKRKFHGFGNSLVRILVNILFKSKLRDIMSGYRVFNKFFVKNFPIMSKGFEIETEMTLHSLDKNFKIIEVPISYRDRPEGSYSKLNTFLDGFKVIRTIFMIFKDYKPFLFFSFLSFLSLIFGLLVGMPVIIEFINTQYITKVPSAILASGLMIISILFFGIGLILDSFIKIHKYNYQLKLLEFKRFH